MVIVGVGPIAILVAEIYCRRNSSIISTSKSSLVLDRIVVAQTSGSHRAQTEFHFFIFPVLLLWILNEPRVSGDKLVVMNIT